MGRWSWIGIVALVGCGDPIPEIEGLAWEANANFLGPFQVSWTQSGDATLHLEYEVDGTWLRTPDIEGLEGANEAVIVGVPFGTTAPYRLVVGDEALVVDGTTELTAPDLPPQLTPPLIDVDEPDLWAESGAYVLVPINEALDNTWLAILDRSGRPVWAAGTRSVLYAQASATGDGIVWGDLTTERAQHAYLDEPINQYPMASHYHAMVDLADGTIAWTGESLRETGPGNRQSTVVWSGEAWPLVLDYGTTPGYIGWPITLPYINGLAYDPASDTYVMSNFESDSVVAVDRGTGEAVWWTTPQESFATAEGGYGFEPPEAAFELQHGGEILDNGNLLISTLRDETVAVTEYEIDHTAQVLREVWTYNSGFEGGQWAWAVRLAGGNTLHTLGPEGIYYEVTNGGEVAWQARFPQARNIMGRAETIVDLYELVSPR